MLTSRISSFDSKPVVHTSALNAAAPCKLACSLRWRQGKLWVSAMLSDRDTALPALASEEWFKACLMRSQAQAVCIDPSLGSAAITLWAKACQAAQKPLFLRLPTLQSLPQKQHWLTWQLKRLADIAIATVLLVVLSPLMVLLAILIGVEDSGPIFYSQWRVGARGKLFRIYKFRSMVVDAESLHSQVMGNQAGLHKLENDPRVTAIGGWMRKFSLDELPQLINVLRGEMSLVGPRPWAIYDAVRIPSELRQRLNAMPGITGAWQVHHRSNELDLKTVNQHDLEYLNTWSILKDLGLLLLTLPKVILGTGAY